MRHLILIFGDQLDHESSVLQEFDPTQDAVWMAEVQEEAAYVWSHKLRLAYFFSAMRHFRDELRARGFPVHYQALTADPDTDQGKTFSEVLRRDVRRLQPQKLIMVQPGDYRVLTALQQTAKALEVALLIYPDNHFFCSRAEFRNHAADKKKLLQEHFYRYMRRTRQILLTREGKPVGGKWNYDQVNRQTFGRHGPPDITPPPPLAAGRGYQRSYVFGEQTFPASSRQPGIFQSAGNRRPGRCFSPGFHRLPPAPFWHF